MSVTGSSNLQHGANNAPVQVSFDLERLVHFCGNLEPKNIDPGLDCAEQDERTCWADFQLPVRTFAKKS